MVFGMLAVVFLVSVLSGYILAGLADSLKLVANPDEYRHHLQPTPLVGGIAIYLGLIAGFFLVDQTFYWLLPSLLFLCMAGVVDDRYTLPSWSRFLIQGIAAYAMIKLTGVQLVSLGYLFSHNEVFLGRWSVPVTVFATVGVINAVNMSDGMDGLAGSLVLLILLSLLLLFKSEDSGLLLISLCTVAGFLVWNIRIGRKQARIFMGDAGSTVLGLLLAYLMIKDSQMDNSIWPVTALWLLALPLIDAVAVLIIRPLRGRSPFSADRIHYHHQLLDRGMAVNTALAIVVVLQLILMGTGWLFWVMRVADFLQFYLFLLLFFLYFLLLFWQTRPVRPL